MNRKTRIIEDRKCNFTLKQILQLHSDALKINKHYQHASQIINSEINKTFRIKYRYINTDDLKYAPKLQKQIDKFNQRFSIPNKISTQIGIYNRIKTRKTIKSSIRVDAFSHDGILSKNCGRYSWRFNHTKWEHYAEWIGYRVSNNIFYKYFGDKKWRKLIFIPKTQNGLTFRVKNYIFRDKVKTPQEWRGFSDNQIRKIINNPEIIVRCGLVDGHYQYNYYTLWCKIDGNWEHYELSRTAKPQIGLEAFKIRKQEALQLKLEKTNYKNIWVSFNDSLESGNCLYGTLEFYNKIREKIPTLPLDPKDISLPAELLMQFKYDSYVRRAIRHAMPK